MKKFSILLFMALLVSILTMGKSFCVQASAPKSGNISFVGIVAAVPNPGIKSMKVQNKPTKPMMKGSRLRLRVRILPAGAKNSKITWTSSNNAVASVTSKGILKANKKGKAQITASVEGSGKKVSFRLRVENPVKLKKIRITGSNQMYVGRSIQLSEVLYPGNASNQGIRWTSSNKAVATVDKYGVVTARKKGKVTITAQENYSKKKAKHKIKVTKVPVTDIEFAPDNKTSMEDGTSMTLALNIAPLDASNQKIIWKSSNKSAATVDRHGTVTAHRPIEAVDITATSADNKNLSCTWTLRITLTDGFITQKMLDDLDLATIHKVMIVAHPDDESFWGGGHLLEDEYLVVCITHGWNVNRRSAFADVMRTTNDKCLILDYPDVRKYLTGGKYETDLLTTCRDALQKDVERVLSYKKWDMVVTHNPTGEYGKYCHQQVSKAVTDGFDNILQDSSELWYFGKFYPAGQIPGEQIDPKLLEIKNRMMARYYSTASGAIKAFGHMVPYENWIPADEWE